MWIVELKGEGCKLSIATVEFDYLCRVAMLIETIHNEGAAKVIYCFIQDSYHRKIFPNYVNENCGIFITHDN